MQSLRARIGNLEHQRFSSLINSMTDGVIAVDHQQKVIEYNGAALSVLDSNRSIMGERLSAVLKPLDAHNEPVNITNLVRTTKIPTVHQEFRLRYQDDSLINLYLSIAPVRTGYGHNQPGGSILVVRDITREKSLEEERDEFISVVSHELRTPIAIVEGNISNALFVAEQNHNPDIVMRSLHDAYDQTTFLAGLINDLAMLSRAEHSKPAKDTSPVNVAQLLTSFTRGYAKEAADKDLLFKVELDPKLELLHTNELYLQEILQNFITNAIKYTEKGGVTVTVKQRTGGVEFQVQDSGIGISKSDQDKIFNKFFRSEDYRTRKTKGTGLGLYVTSKLAYLLRARITVESQLNHGSVFKILIPDLKHLQVEHPDKPNPQE